jgi:hypothetical protein
VANIVFAAQSAVIGPEGRRLLKPREDPRSDEKPTVDELTGDGLALHQITVHLTQYEIESEAFSAGQGDQPYRDRHPVFLIGGPYSNEFLCGLEEAELADVPTPFGARFDIEAPLRDRKNRVILYRPDKGDPITKEVDILDAEHSSSNTEYAVIRRWLTRAPYENDAILVAGLTAQGTAAAAHFICNSLCMAKLFARLKEKGAADETWEWTQWDALLAVRLTGGKFYRHLLPEIVDATLRFPLPKIERHTGSNSAMFSTASERDITPKAFKKLPKTKKVSGKTIRTSTLPTSSRALSGPRSFPNS